MKYSGRTTAYEHKRDDWESKKGPFKPALSEVTVFDVQWSDCPVEVEAAVKELWRDHDFGNDNYFYAWDSG